MNIPGLLSSSRCRIGVMLLVLLAPPVYAAIPSPVGSYRHMRGAGREITTTKIADGVWQFTVARDSYVRQLNSVAIIGSDGVIVYDTCTRPSTARLILTEIRKLTSKPVGVVIDSHWHPDHWSGNEVFAQAFPDVEIIATEAVRQAMENTSGLWPGRFAAELRSQQDALKKAIATGKLEDGTPLTPQLRREQEEDVQDYAGFASEAAATHYVLPTLTYVDHLELHRGGEEVRLLSVTGDAVGTTVLYLPRRKVLLTGDALSYPIPYISRPAEQVRTLRTLAAMHPSVIVPGHGPAFHDTEYLELEAALLTKVVDGVHRSLQKGALTLADVQREVTVDELRLRFTGGDPVLDRRYRDRVQAIVKLAVREARGGVDL